MKRFSGWALRCLGLGCTTLAVCAFAQDVVIAPLAWVEPKDAPQELPVRSGKLRVEFPRDLEKTPDVGWAMLDISLDASGKVRSIVPRGTQPLYTRALSLGNAGRNWKPGRRAGAPVSTRVRLTATFNPAAANPKAANASPRLLDAFTISDPTWTSDERMSWRDEQRDGWADVQLDDQGSVTEVTTDDVQDQMLVKTGVQRWRFAPATKDGRAVAGRLRVPFVITPQPSENGADREIPKYLSGTPPTYPLAMLRSGLRGDVVVEFIVDPEGRVKNPSVVRTLNPGFNEAALAAVRTFTFEPGRIDGRAVATKMQQPIAFAIEDARDGGDDGLEVRRRADPSKLPPELRYDTPPKIDALTRPVYPFGLLRAKVRGSATVNLLIGPNGKVLQSRVRKADRPELGLALQAAAELFEYLPALKNGRPTLALIGFTQEFALHDSPLITDEDRELLALETKHPEKILKAGELDHPLKMTVVHPPVFPKTDGATLAAGGEALIEFLVDEKGSVRLPRVVSASAPEFGYAAVQALAGCQFEPPTAKGRPGVARVEVPVSFQRPSEKPSEPK